MPQTHHVVAAAILDASIETARRRGSANEIIALGLVAALRRLHAAVEEASDSMALSVRATIRDIILAHNLARFRESKTRPVPSMLPVVGSDVDRVGIAILEDAANSCLALNAFTPSNGSINAAIRLLTERLIEVLGAPPDYAALADRITGSAAEGPGAFAVPQRTSSMLN